ncbi:Protein CBG16532 [Caenorhabditis briggsae]|uniref:Protein CBG16532 n=2 Tax=Caenorhabditis briggsae TaxID=6238 RepID=A8XPF3_CAEBR|nr:Protein CBG16532 [Caenorhabditis briggsae]ULU01073.1 hypothetical protein L3Y34_001450 [Caenorhabditis briggsae]CAP34474.1 Protein CBG16532 [Caenorhabditis briggsae]
MSSKSRSSSKEKKSSSKKEKKEKSSKKESSKKEKKVKKPKTPEPEYEDDFEQYEEDFEDFNDDRSKEKETPTAEEAAREEKPLIIIETDETPFEGNLLQRLATSHMRRTEIAPQKQIPKASSHTQISFQSTIENKPYSYHNEEERQTQEQRAFGRLNKLRGLISIEVTKSQVFTDISSNIFEPLSSTPSNKAHALTQTGKECNTEEVQTEKGEMEDEETQCPHSESTRIENGLEKERTSSDRARLKKFFFAATQTIREILISDDKSAEEDETSEKSISKFSRGYNPFRLYQVVTKCKATCIKKGESDSVLIAYEIFESPAPDLINKSLIAEFYVHKRRPPKRLFVVESVVSAMELSQASQTLYVCLMDGTFCAFDLSITDAFFEDTLPWVDSDTDIALRRPTFDSSFLATTITDATPLVGITVSKSNIGEDITTIDSSGTISYWVANRIETNELRVLLTAVIRPHPVLKRHSSSFAVSAFCHTTNPLRFFIGTDTGMMYSVYKSDTSQAIPKIFKTEKEKYGEVAVIAANPTDNTVLLIGFSNGSISVYRTSQTSAIVNLPTADLSTRVTMISWSLTNPSGFYTIHNGNSISFWDLGFKLSSITTDSRNDSNQVLACDTWLSESAKIGYMAFGLSNGDSEVHVLEDPARKNQNETILDVLRRIKNL